LFREWFSRQAAIKFTAPSSHYLQLCSQLRTAASCNLNLLQVHKLCSTPTTKRSALDHNIHAEYNIRKSTWKSARRGSNSLGLIKFENLPDKNETLSRSTCLCTKA
jgi:hypothetical protein